VDIPPIERMVMTFIENITPICHIEYAARTLSPPPTLRPVLLLALPPKLYSKQARNNRYEGDPDIFPASQIKRYIHCDWDPGATCSRNLLRIQLGLNEEENKFKIQN